MELSRHRFGDGDTSESDWDLQEQAEQKGAVGEDERDRPGVDETLDVLLNREDRHPEKRESCGPDPNGALINCEPEQANRREDGDELRRMSEVVVKSRIDAANEPIGEVVADKNAGAGERQGKSPCECACSHTHIVPRVAISR